MADIPASKEGRRSRQCNPNLAHQGQVRASFNKPTARSIPAPAIPSTLTIPKIILGAGRISGCEGSLKACSNRLLKTGSRVWCQRPAGENARHRKFEWTGAGRITTKMPVLHFLDGLSGPVGGESGRSGRRARYPRRQEEQDPRPRRVGRECHPQERRRAVLRFYRATEPAQAQTDDRAHGGSQQGEP